MVKGPRSSNARSHYHLWAERTRGALSSRPSEWVAVATAMANVPWRLWPSFYTRMQPLQPCWRLASLFSTLQSPASASHWQPLHRSQNYSCPLLQSWVEKRGWIWCFITVIIQEPFGEVRIASHVLHLLNPGHASEAGTQEWGLCWRVKLGHHHHLAGFRSNWRSEMIWTERLGGVTMEGGSTSWELVFTCRVKGMEPKGKLGLRDQKGGERESEWASRAQCQCQVSSGWCAHRTCVIYSPEYLKTHIKTTGLVHRFEIEHVHLHSCSLKCTQWNWLPIKRMLEI